MGLEKARLVIVSTEPEEFLDLLYNPTEYSIERGAQYAEQQVPGRQLPLLQYVSGAAQTLTVELFLDRTAQRRSIEDDLEHLRRLVRIDKELHAPPVCRFEYGVGVPRSARSKEAGRFFTGVVTSLRENHVLFDEDGAVLRARVTLTLKAYQPASVQAREHTTNSPDRSRFRVLREGETLSHLAIEAYGDPRQWRVIAEANDIDRPRFVTPGTPLWLPSIGTGIAPP